MENRKLVSIEAAARELGLSQKTLSRMVREGEVPFYAIRDRKRVVVSEVLAATARPTQPAAE